MADSIDWTAEQAVRMFLAGGGDPACEVSRPTAAYLDICEDIEADGGEAAFGQEEYVAALRSEIDRRAE